MAKQYINDDWYKEPKKPTMPTVSFSETVTKGTLSDTTNKNLGVVYTPGAFDPSIHNISSFNYPIYNKPTGLYALLKTPRFSFGNFLRNDSTKSIFEGVYTYDNWQEVE
jgi:hypothetical protein